MEKESYKVQYRNGKKHGKEQLFSENGKVLGEGEFKEGVPLGKHWRNARKWTASLYRPFDQQGKLLEPILEFTDQGQKIAEYFLVGEKRKGVSHLVSRWKTEK